MDSFAEKQLTNPVVIICWSESIIIDWTMDLKSSSPSPVLTENVSINKSWMALLPNSLLCSSPPGTFPAGLHLTIPRKKTGILDDVRASGWLDAMKASSPPPRMMIRDFNTEDAAADADAVYRTWMVCWLSFLPLVVKIFWQLRKEVVLSNDSNLRSLLFPNLQVKYPSAIVSFDQIINFATDKKIVLFLDYDGTLSPIVDNPDRAFMSRSVRNKKHCSSWDISHLSYFVLVFWFVLPIFLDA